MLLIFESRCKQRRLRDSIYLLNFVLPMLGLLSLANVHFQGYAAFSYYAPIFCRLSLIRIDRIGRYIWHLCYMKCNSFSYNFQIRKIKARFTSDNPKMAVSYSEEHLGWTNTYDSTVQAVNGYNSYLRTDLRRNNGEL